MLVNLMIVFLVEVWVYRFFEVNLRNNNKCSGFSSIGWYFWLFFFIVIKEIVYYFNKEEF